jgi:hypothetical protein
MISSSSQFQFYVVPVPMHLRQIIEAIGAHSIPKMAQLRDQELANLV